MPNALPDRIIASMNRENPLAECQNCERAFHIQRAKLFYVSDIAPDTRKQIDSWRREIESGHKELRERRKQMAKTSTVGAQSVNLGFLFEAIAPVLPTFPFNPHDCRALGDPIDLIIFHGLAEHGRVDNLIFADVKTGASRLSNRQKSVRDAVNKNRIEWGIY